MTSLDSPDSNIDSESAKSSGSENQLADQPSKEEDKGKLIALAVIAAVILLIPVVTRHSFVDAAKVLFIYMCVTAIGAGLILLFNYKQLMSELIIAEELALGIRDETIGHLREIRTALIRVRNRIPGVEHNGSEPGFSDIAKHALPLAMMFLKGDASTFKLLGQGLKLGHKLYSIFQNK